MDCSQVKTSLADFSVEQLSPSQAQQLLEHCAQCPPCEAERVLFQHTLLIASTTPQPLLSPRQSQEIWHACVQSMMNKTERERLQKAQPAAARSPFSLWARSQPRWAWGALGGAFAVLGGVWLLSPQDEGLDLPVPARVNAGLVRFASPPPGASPFINHHAAMAFDPFADHVGSTLVSSSAPPSTKPASSVAAPPLAPR